MGMGGFEAVFPAEAILAARPVLKFSPSSAEKRSVSWAISFMGGE
jgi:hypothetical protein